MISKFRHWWFMLWWKVSARQIAKDQKKLDELHKRWMKDYD